MAPTTANDASSHLDSGLPRAEDWRGTSFEEIIMKRQLATAFAAVALAAAGAAFACEYSAMDDGVALAPTNATKVPVAAACEGNGCAAKSDRLRVAAPKPVAKSLVVAVKNTSPAGPALASDSR
jgi:hypothetical protein